MVSRLFCLNQVSSHQSVGVSDSTFTPLHPKTSSPPIMLCGGAQPAVDATPEIQAVCDKVKAQVEEKVGRSLAVFEAKSYSTQVVAGKNFFVKIHIGDDDKCVHARIHQDLQQNVSLHSLQQDKAHDEAVGYF